MQVKVHLALAWAASEEMAANLKKKPHICLADKCLQEIKAFVFFSDLFHSQMGFAVLPTARSFFFLAPALPGYSFYLLTSTAWKSHDAHHIMGLLWPRRMALEGQNGVLTSSPAANEAFWDGSVSWSTLGWLSTGFTLRYTLTQRREHPEPRRSLSIWERS